MSAGETSEAIIRTPPSIYSGHQVKPIEWTQSSPPNKPNGRQLKATVTKVSSGDRKKDLTERKFHKPDTACSCGGWARAKQMNHDLLQLQNHHEIILKGLHQQVEELKSKNRDLNFIVVMQGPKPQSSRSLKNSTKEASTQTKLETVPIKSQELQIDDEKSKSNKQLEDLEKKHKETKSLLSEEKMKSEYLSTIVEDLKRKVDDSYPLWSSKSSSKSIHNRSFKDYNSFEHIEERKPFHLPAIVRKTDDDKFVELSPTAQAIQFKSKRENITDGSTSRQSNPLPSIRKEIDRGIQDINGNTNSSSNIKKNSEETGEDAQKEKTAADGPSTPPSTTSKHRHRNRKRKSERMKLKKTENIEA